MVNGGTYQYAARLNAFKVGAADYWPGLNREVGTLDLIDRAATVPGLGAVDLNFPDHLERLGELELVERLEARGLALNGFAMRYYSEPAFKLGAFTHPDAAVRRAAIDLTRRGIDSLRRAGGRIMTLWLGQDGFDYSFQADYGRVWEQQAEAIGAVARHDPEIDVSLEYKPNEPRAFAMLPDVATTLLMIDEVGLPNLGVTLDFAHLLYADEMPAYAATLVARRSRLLGIHLNDGYGKRDDGLMVGAVHLVQTVELLHALRRLGYAGTLYFDTFPDQSGLDPVAECSANIATVEALHAAALRLEEPAVVDALAAALATQDAVASQRLVQAALLRA